MRYKILFVLLTFAWLSGCGSTSEVVRDKPGDIFEGKDAKEVVKQARDYHDKGEFETAAIGYQKSADEGVAVAQNNLGVMYYEGRGVTQDLTQAVNWFRKAADQGLVDAQFNIAQMYHAGKGIEQDIEQATQWYRKAAEQGDIRALSRLGEISETHLAAHQAFFEVKQEIKEEADNGDVKAQTTLGNLYYHGNGVIADFTKAMQWFQTILFRIDVL